MAATGYTSGDPRKVDKAGDTLTGPLVLSGDPASPLVAAPKQYVDVGDTAAVAAAASDATGKVSAHVASADPHGDRAHAAATYLPLAGGTVTGDLTVSGRMSAAGWALPMLAPANRPPLYRVPSSIVTLMQTGHGWSASGTVASSNLNDAADFTRGTQSARITSTGAGGSGANLQRFGMSAMDLTKKAVRLLLKIDDVSNVANINFFIGTSSLASNFKWRFWITTTSSRMIQSGEWVMVTLSWADVNTAAGSYSLSSGGVPSTTIGFTDMRFQVVDTGGGPVTARLQAVELVDDITVKHPSGVVSVVFDDSWGSVYDLARPRMDQYGYRGTQYTIASHIGTADRLTLPQLRTLQDVSGWEVAGHAYTSAAHDARYPTLTAAQVDDDLRNLRAWLVNNSFAGDSFAYPGGRFESTVDGVPVERLVARYFSSGRTILSATGVSANIVGDTYPPPRPYRINAMSAISSLSASPYNATGLTSAGGPLDRCRNSGSWLILTFHRITAGAPSTTSEISQADFNIVMDGIASRGIPVLPVGEVMR